LFGINYAANIAGLVVDGDLMRSLPLWFGRISGKTAVGKAVLRLIADESGVTAIEYALITTLIVMALVALITQIGDFVSTPFETVASHL
jgi:Flp pilus assembly pilin Flp